jgi:hypothetical protein
VQSGSTQAMVSSTTPSPMSAPVVDNGAAAGKPAFVVLGDLSKGLD